MSDRRHLRTDLMQRTSEAAFETVIEAPLLENGYERITGEGYDRNRAIFSDTAPAFIRETQPKERIRLESLHGDGTDENPSVSHPGIRAGGGVPCRRADGGTTVRMRPPTLTRQTSPSTIRVE